MRATPRSPRLYEAGVAGGVLPRPKGPKPILGGPVGTEEPVAAGGDDAGGVGRRRTRRAAGRHVADGLRSTSSRRTAVGWDPAPTGPATPEDAWKWEGVPPGRGLIGKVEAGEMRYYMGDDGHGPCIKWLPPAWPPEPRERRRVSGERGVALPVRAARARRRAGRVAGRSDRHRRGRPGVRRARAAVGAQRIGRGRGHRHPRPLRRAGDGARGGPYG